MKIANGFEQNKISYICPSTLMKRANKIKSFTCLMVTFFLLTSIVCNSFNLANQSRKVDHETYTHKSHDRSTPSNSQLPYKEVEKEASDLFEELQKDIEFIYLIIDPVCVSLGDPQAYALYNAPRSCGNATDVPIYLATRTLLI
jgi:hypothetical protein